MRRTVALLLGLASMAACASSADARRDEPTMDFDPATCHHAGQRCSYDDDCCSRKCDWETTCGGPG